jgi:solute:Na+ symporter, SSS family
MGTNYLDLIAIIFYFVSLLAFGILVRRVKGFEDYSLGKRMIPSSMIFASLAATYIGPGFSVGLTGKGFSTGYLFYLLPLAFVIQTLIVGKWLAHRLHGFSKCYTVGDIIGEKYGKLSHLLAGIVSVGLCIGFSAIMAKVGGVILSQAIGLELVWSIAIITGIGVIYTYTGGLKSVIATEAYQFSIFTIVLPMVVFFCIIQPAFDFDVASQKAIELTKNSFSSFSGIQIFGIAISFLLGETLVPPYTNRALASGSASEASKGFLAAGFFGIIWIGVVVGLGIVGASLLPASTPEDEVFMKLVITYVPHGLIGIVLIALVAIVMSSQESVLNAGAVAFTRDITLRFRSLTDNQSLLMSRIYTLVVGILAIFFALYAPSIIDGLLIMYSIWAPAILLPLVLGLFIQNTREAAGYLSIIFGGGSSLIWRLGLGEPLDIPSIIVGITAAGIGYIIGHFTDIGYILAILFKKRS